MSTPPLYGDAPHRWSLLHIVALVTDRRRSVAAVVGASALVLAIALSPSAAHASGDPRFGVLRDPGDVAFIAAHRGDRATAPENTMPAFRAAIDGNLEFVETDVRLSKDGVPVLFHDARLHRTAGVEGRVKDLSLAELRQLDVGSWFSPAYVGTRIPTLSELLGVLAPSDKKLLLELKGDWKVKQLRAVVDELRAWNLADRVILPSFSEVSIENMAKAGPEFSTALLTPDLPEDIIQTSARLGVIGVITTATAISTASDTVATLHHYGFGVMVYTLNEQTDWSQMRAYGVDGIITDIPSALDGWLARTSPGT